MVFITYKYENIFLILFFILIGIIILSKNIYAQCEINITSLPYTINQNNRYYCLNQSFIDITLPEGWAAISFSSGIQNNTLDCLNLNLDGKDDWSTFGIYLTGINTKNNIIKNCIVTDFYYGIWLDDGPNNNYLYNNTVNSNAGGILVWGSSSNNILANNIANENWKYGGLSVSSSNTLMNNIANWNNYGIYLSSGYNNLMNNIANNNYNIGIFLYNSNYGNLANNIANNNSGGIALSGSSNNNISGGSIASNLDYDYSLSYADSSNYFRATNFTTARSIDFRDATIKFIYNDDNIWLKTNLSAASKIVRKIISWDQNLMQWSDNPISAVTAKYELAGLLPSAQYYVYNDSSLTYTLQTNNNGELNFTIYLSSEHEIKVSSTAVQASLVWSSDSNGNEKNTFYSNETIYVISNKIISTSTQVRIYIVNDSNSWTNGTSLVDVSTGYKTISTNSSGYLPTTAIWYPTLIAGKYDIVADVNQDGVYNSSIDLVDSLTTTGFEVIEIPAPTLSISVGLKSPSDHSWDLNINGSSYNVMLQLKFTAGNIENVRINSIGLVANGSGNDATGISMVRLVLDVNSNSVFDENDILLTYGKYLTNDGVLTLNIGNGYIVNANTSVNIIIVYTMTNSSLLGDTYSFRVLSISSTGTSSGSQTKITGLPVNSAVKTISGVPLPMYICSDYKNQTSCANVGCMWCNSDSSCRNATEKCPTCYGSMLLSLEKQEKIVLAIVSGLSGCDNKIAYLKESSCAGAQTGNCSVLGSGCSISFLTPSEGNHTYYICVDKNENGDFEADEQVYSILTIQYQATFPRIPIGLDVVILLIVTIIVLVITFWYYKTKYEKIDEFEKLKEKWRTPPHLLYNKL